MARSVRQWHCSLFGLGLGLGLTYTLTRTIGLIGFHTLRFVGLIAGNNNPKEAQKDLEFDGTLLAAVALIASLGAAERSRVIAGCTHKSEPSHWEVLFRASGSPELVQLMTINVYRYRYIYLFIYLFI